MKKPFKMKGYSYPGKAPIKHYTGHEHSHTETDLDTGVTENPYVDAQGNPIIDYGISWSNTEGLKPIISKKGWTNFANWGKKTWDKSSTLGKIGIGLAHGAAAGIAIADPGNIPGVAKTVGNIFKGSKSWT